MKYLLMVVPWLAAGLGAIMLVGFLAIRASRARYRFRCGRVHGVTGELGGGKSMFVVGEVLGPVARELVSRRGLRDGETGRQVRQIITNFTFDPAEVGAAGANVVQLAPAPGVTLWQQIIGQGQVVEGDDGEADLRLDAVVVIDEMALFAPSDQSKLDPLAKVFLTHARKWNCEVWWIAQEAFQVHKRARMLSQRLWMCSEVGGAWAMLVPGRWFAARSHKRDKDGNLADLVDKKVYRARKSVMRAYRSFETVAASAEDVSAIADAMQRAGLKAGESRHNDLARALGEAENVTIPEKRVLTVKNATGRGMPAPAGQVRRSDLREQHGTTHQTI